MEKRKPLLKREQIIKLQRLLDMMYKPSEIADEIGVNVYTIWRSYLPAGAPHDRDKSGNIWIHGPSFREWALTQAGLRKRKKHELQPDEAWCMKCNKPVKINNGKERPINKHTGLLQGKCALCGAKVNRLTANGSKEGKK
ncbi:MAG: hypothetical protein CL609_23850 [Anaerolineaceae bacterium]|nr:hypothetical protein [Anaerolineaceae bacterium]